jgi:hypothetical protein
MPAPTPSGSKDVQFPEQGQASSRSRQEWPLRATGVRVGGFALGGLMGVSSPPLPFKESGGLLSVIVSKAFLLANDTAITDPPSITHQLRTG